MLNRSKRWISLVLAVVMCTSVLILPAAAMEAGESPAAAASDLALEAFLNPEPVEEIEDTPPMIHILPEPETLPAAGEDSTLPEDDSVQNEDVAGQAPSAEEDESAETPAEEEIVEGDISGEVPSEETSGEPAIEEEAVLDGAGEYIITYYSGETVLATETVQAGQTPAQVPAADGNGTPITAWLNAAGSFVTPSGMAVSGDTDLYAWYAPALETQAHKRYVNGVGNAMFAPNVSLTRAEAATILYNLLISKERGPYTVTFTDVNSWSWYYEAVMTLASYKVLNGVGNDMFAPDDYITRAEFVTMLVRIYGVTETESSFTDVPSGSWSESFVATAADRGWVQGDGDGTFRPNDSITRAEAVVIMNRVLGRKADKETIAAGEGILRYLDVAENDWYYWDIMEASISHEVGTGSDGEIWTDYVVENCGLEPGFHNINGTLCYVSSESGQLVWLEFGLNEVDDIWLYAAREGYAVHTNITEANPTYGFNYVDGHAFFWDTTTGDPMYFTQGLNPLQGYTFYADEDGYFINNTFQAGVVELGGKLYIAGKNCNIVTTYYDYTSGTAVKKDLAGTTYEYNKNMYYVKEDYSLARDEWIQYLYFDNTGKYTTGDATLDAYVYDIVDDFIDNNALTPVKKLMKAYYTIRGGDGANAEPASGYWYLNRFDGYERGRYNGQKHYSWLQSCAKTFFSTKKGSCYYWAGAYLYVARRLGFQSYAVVGDVFNTDTRHCWCMVYWDGAWHISDVEVEWGYLNGFYTGGKHYYFNLFDQKVSSQWISSYVNPELSSIKYYFPS